MTRWTVPLPVATAEQSPLRRALEPLGFWASVLLPGAYLPLLYGGLGAGQLRLFLGLVALNVVCLVAGHPYAR